MAMSHAEPWQAIDLAPLGGALPDTPAHALVKTHALELIRLVLRAGETRPPHSVYGEMTLHCLEGELVVEGEGVDCALRPNQLVLLPAQARYALRALRDASVLMTVQLPPGLPGSGSSTL
jgi:quercetin dioxygenase-like cupin family protein